MKGLPRGKLETPLAASEVKCIQAHWLASFVAILQGQGYTHLRQSLHLISRLTCCACLSSGSGIYVIPIVLVEL